MNFRVLHESMTGIILLVRTTLCMVVNYINGYYKGQQLKFDHFDDIDNYKKMLKIWIICLPKNNIYIWWTNIGSLAM